jgi:hypothetical protein
LQTLEIRGCLPVTSIGLASISMNCKQLNRLDIKKCYNIDDSGMIPLAHFSQNLRQVFISSSQFRAKHKKCMKALIRILMLCLFSWYADKLVVQLSYRCRASFTCRYQLPSKLYPTSPARLVPTRTSGGVIGMWRANKSKASC